MNSHEPPQKADFCAIYDQPDPWAYFGRLEPFAASSNVTMQHSMAAPTAPSMQD